MRISDWSSDVCSSDLFVRKRNRSLLLQQLARVKIENVLEERVAVMQLFAQHLVGDDEARGFLFEIDRTLKEVEVLAHLFRAIRFSVDEMNRADPLRLSRQQKALHHHERPDHRSWGLTT